MFGYLKIYKDEMKLKNIKNYKKKYCTLCYGIRENLGYVFSAILNYESVFLYIFLESLVLQDKYEKIEFRCSMNPVIKVNEEVNKELLEYVSFVNYYLTMLKLKDNCNDEKSYIDKLLLYCLQNNKKYLQKEEKYRELFRKIECQYVLLYELENEEGSSFDVLAETMGNVLQEIVLFFCDFSGVCTEKENVKKFCGHLGKWIYLIDAYDDFERDDKRNSFNPLNEFREDSEENALKAGEWMLGMMIYKLDELLKAIPISKNREIIYNIIEYGTVQSLRWAKYKKTKRRKSKNEQ